ncbi:MAG: pyrroline-5-carboxylate reductase [Gammaproteobacteria bacterium]|nr:pyrroline-5-carboxylate reductase [Gammaproteobacteria bacterium]
MTPHIAFIGGGNMGRAIIGGLLKRGQSPQGITVSDPVTATRAALVQEFGIIGAADNNRAVANADIVVLAVKPQQMAAIVRALAPMLAERRPVVLSIAAGITTASIAQWCGASLPLVRAMPNTPALVGRAATGVFATAATSVSAREQVAELLRAIGFVVWVESEEQLDAVTALSGSGPAYFFLLLECLEAAAVRLGLPVATARQLALETAAGAAELALQSPYDPATLRVQVTSKGGTTERALAVFETGGFADLVQQALGAAARRAHELSVEFGGG